VTRGDEPEPVGLVGLGLLGSALAERLLAADFRVVGCDLDPERVRHFEGLGGVAAADAADIARLCPRVLFSLPTSEIAASVAAEIAPSLVPNAVVIDTTTGHPRQMEEIARLLADRGAAYVDATVAGSSQQAREGNVIVMAGGDGAVIDRCRDLFATFAREVFAVGPVGSGARMKLVVNLVLGLNRAVLAEGLAFARACGFNPADALRILAAGPAYSRAMDVKGEKMLRGDFTPQARLSQHLKDVRLILAEGAEVGARLPLSEVHRLLLEEVEAAGLGDADNSAIFRAFE